MANITQSVELLLWSHSTQREPIGNPQGLLVTCLTGKWYERFSLHYQTKLPYFDTASKIRSFVDSLLDGTLTSELNKYTLVDESGHNINAEFAASLVGEWDLNNTVADTSPYGTDNNSGRLSGLTEFIPDGDFGHVFRFAGDGYLEIPNTEDINLGNHAKRTVSVWVNADSTQPRQTIFEEGGTVRGLNIYLDGGKIYFGGWNEPDSESAWKGTFLNADITEGWHLASLTLDATLWTGATEPNAFTAYLDGQLIGSGDGSQLWGHADPTAFGATAGATLYHDGPASAGNYLTGDIAKPKIFNRTLSAAEIQNLYENFS